MKSFIDYRLDAAVRRERLRRIYPATRSVNCFIGGAGSTRRSNGRRTAFYLDHECKTIPKELLHLPHGDFIDRVTADSNRSPQVLRSLSALFNSGRLAGSGYLSILPVDQGIEHSAGASFAANPIYFDPETAILKITLLLQHLKQQEKK